VDAVVNAPFGALPGTVQGYYASDTPHVIEVVGSVMRGLVDAYLERWVYSLESQQELLEKRMGVAKLLELQQRETIKEGYRP
jgi:glutaconate CoA-transferase subunit A